MLKELTIEKCWKAPIGKCPRIPLGRIQEAFPTMREKESGEPIPYLNQRIGEIIEELNKEYCASCNKFEER